MNPPSTRVSIIGAGKVGSTLAQRIAEKNLADVVLLDIVEGWPQGVALDLMQARGVERHDRQIVGTNNYIDTANSNIIVIAAGIPRKPGINREDLIKINARIVTEAAKQAIAHSPEAILIVVTNPLDIMTYLAWEAVDLPKHRVMGMGGILDSARFQTFIAMELGISIAQVCATVIGSHGDLMVPLPRYSTVNGIPIVQLMDAGAIDRIVQRTRHGGAEVVSLMKTSSAYFAPASSACLMVESILLNQSRLLSCSVYLQGEYGVQDIFLGSPCRLGSRGVEQIVELELSNTEKAALIESGKVVAQNIEEAKAILKTPDASK
ncbi:MULTISPECIES: malate dehydrogenase [unclassified Microcoleus]|uniref:malate dehydrogenase n=1 Tax=unclassified Microcoleus TaxID=2642155 RepID=UPI002FD1D54E